MFNYLLAKRKSHAFEILILLLTPGLLQQVMYVTCCKMNCVENMCVKSEILSGNIGIREHKTRATCSY